MGKQPRAVMTDLRADSQGLTGNSRKGRHHPTIHFAPGHAVRSRPGLSPYLTDMEIEAGSETGKTVHSPGLKSAPLHPRFC